MNTIAELRRAMPEGAEVEVENLLYPQLTGRRRVVKAQTNAWCLSFPAGHPKVDHPGSWVTMPKRADVVFEGDTALISMDGTPYLRLTPLKAA